MGMPCICCGVDVKFEELIRLMAGEPNDDGDVMSYPIHEPCYKSCTPADLAFLREHLAQDSDEAKQQMKDWRIRRQGSHGSRQPPTVGKEEGVLTKKWLE